MTRRPNREPWRRLARDLRRNHGISRAVLVVYRFGTWADASATRAIAMQVYRLLDLVIVKLLAGADLPAECDIGGGVVLKHGGKGVVVNRDVVLGDEVVLYHGVTIGHMEPADVQGKAPRVGSRVFIGAGAVVLGDVHVADDALIGANAVVVTDVPAGATAVGVPARITTSRDRPWWQRQ